jgi:ribonuclease VapC
MVVDASALIAILADEPERRPFVEAIEAAEIRLISAATFVEASIVLETRHGADGTRLLDLFLDRAGIDIVDVDAEQAREARRGFARFGRGRHPAGLNFGDCFAYALSLTSGEPLLFKGSDFSQTDVEAVA